MRKITPIIFFWTQISLLLQLCEASGLSVTYPIDVKEKTDLPEGHFEATLANYGHIDYGTIFVSYSFYHDLFCRIFFLTFFIILTQVMTIFCKQLGQIFLPKTNKDACLPFSKDMFTPDAQRALFQNLIAHELPVILAERGNCTFVTKSRNVE